MQLLYLTIECVAAPAKRSKRIMGYAEIDPIDRMDHAAGIAT
jgi:hypothetical protein